jgi:hypothetical protein
MPLQRVYGALWGMLQLASVAETTGPQFYV